MFEPEFEERVDAIVARYPASRAALLPVLWEVQKHDGWVSSQAESWVAGRLNVTPAHVHGAVTFYTMYKQRPTGRHHIQVCTTLTCMLRGCDELMEHLKDRLGVQEGQITQDGKFSLVRVECLGSCGTAPMCQINDDYHEDLTLEKVDRLLDSLP